MRKFFVILTALVLSFSCNKSELIPVESKTVSVSFDYSFRSGSMLTKSVFGDVFYDKIISKELAADSFNIKFVEESTGETYYFKGNWCSKDLFTIKTGKYKVTGNSTATGYYIQSKCSFVFDTEIEINSSDEIIVLPAKYDCFLLIFSTENVRDVVCYYSGSKDGTYSNGANLIGLDGGKYIYGFSKKLYNEGAKNPALCVGLKSSTNNYSWFYTETINFEVGKYYLYDPVANNFSIPKMERGNI